MRERDADYASLDAALRAGSTMRAEHQNYATRCPAPYSYSYFWRRFADWLDAQPDAPSAYRQVPRRALGASSEANRGLPAASAKAAIQSGAPKDDDRSAGFPDMSLAGLCRVGSGRAMNPHEKVPSTIPLGSEIHASPTNTSDALPIATGNELAVRALRGRLLLSPNRTQRCKYARARSVFGTAMASKEPFRGGGSHPFHHPRLARGERDHRGHALRRR